MSIDDRIKKIKLIAFDLDNTLYDEIQYFQHAFDIISSSLQTELGLNSKKIKNDLLLILKNHGKHYHSLFDDFISNYNLDHDHYLPYLLKLYCEVDKKLLPYPGVKDLLLELNQKYEIAIITSGMYDGQKNKIRLLEFENIFKTIIFGSKLSEDKPSIVPFEYLLKITKTIPEQVVYIGDNPLTDFRGANQLGILTIRTNNPEFDNIDVNLLDTANIEIYDTIDVKQLFL